MKRYEHIDFTPPEGAREAARRALEVRAEKPESQRGMTPVGIARARDLAAGKTLSPETVRRMLSFFQRHEVDKQGSTWDEQGKGWQAWQGWGGDPGYAWARKVVRQMDAADTKTMAADAVDVSAVGYRAYPFEEGSWDADAAVGRLRSWAGVDVDEPSADAWNRYAEGFAIVRGPRENLGSYLLPHHDVKDGELVTVPAGVSAAIGALHGARAGGVDVPADVRDAALEHLEKHRAAWEKSRTARCPSVAISMSAEPVSRSMIQIARCGEFKGHPQGGFSMNGETFAGIINNFQRTANRRIPVDYEHATEMVASTSVLQNGAPAVGWCTDLEVRGDTLWAKIDWVDPTAVERIRAGQYAYCSPAIVFGAIDPESGESIGAKLTSVALTNRPFLDGMAPITARDAARASLSPESVHIPAATTVAEVKMDDEKKMAAAPEGKAMARLRAMAAKYMAMPEHEATENEIMEAIEALLEKFEASQAMEAAQMSDRVIAEGRAPAAARDRLVRLCRADRGTFDALYPAQEAPAADARLMSARVAPQGGVAPAPVGASPVRHADAAHDRAVRLMSDRGLDYKTALLQASRDLRDEALAPLTQILGGLK